MAELLAWSVGGIPAASVDCEHRKSSRSNPTDAASLPLPTQPMCHLSFPTSSGEMGPVPRRCPPEGPAAQWRLLCCGLRSHLYVEYRGSPGSAQQGLINSLAVPLSVRRLLSLHLLLIVEGELAASHERGLNVMMEVCFLHTPASGLFPVMQHFSRNFVFTVLSSLVGKILCITLVLQRLPPSNPCK